MEVFWVLEVGLEMEIASLLGMEMGRSLLPQMDMGSHLVSGICVMKTVQLQQILWPILREWY